MAHQQPTPAGGSAARDGRAESNGQSGAEQRSSKRKPAHTSGVISTTGRRTSLLCTVRDISATGARLQVYAMARGSFSADCGLPKTFTLVVQYDRFEVDCEIAWRRPDEVGVRFTSQFRSLRGSQARPAAVASPRR